MVATFYVRQPLASRVRRVRKGGEGRVLLLEIELAKGMSWCLTGVYGWPERKTKEEKRKVRELWTAHIPKMWRMLETSTKWVFTVAGDFNLQVGEELELEMLQTAGEWELTDVAGAMGKENPTFWPGQREQEARDRLDRVLVCEDVLAAVSDFQVGRMGRMGIIEGGKGLDHEIVEMELDWQGVMCVGRQDRG